MSSPLSFLSSRLTIFQFLVMKLRYAGSASSKEATSGQGPASETGMSVDEYAGPVLAQELCAGNVPAAAGGHSGFEHVLPALQRICRRLTKYGIQRTLGRGASGLVLLADDLKHGGKVAIKVMKRPTPGYKSNRHNLTSELSILRHLSSMPVGRTIVTEFKESFVDAYNYYIIMVRRVRTYTKL